MRERLIRNRFALFLGLLTLGCIFLMLTTSSDPLPDSLRGTAVGALLTQFPTGNQTIFDVAVGIVVSLILYVLVVWLPEQNKPKRIRRSLQLCHEQFKRECIRAFLDALGEGHEPALIDRLKDRHEFRLYFDENISPIQNRWHAVANRLSNDESIIKSLIVECDIFGTEIHFTLTAIDVANPDAFAFFKNLAGVLYRSRI